MDFFFTNLRELLTFFLLIFNLFFHGYLIMFFIFYLSSVVITMCFLYVASVIDYCNTNCQMNQHILKFIIFCPCNDFPLYLKVGTYLIRFIINLLTSTDEHFFHDILGSEPTTSHLRAIKIVIPLNLYSTLHTYRIPQPLSQYVSLKSLTALVSEYPFIKVTPERSACCATRHLPSVPFNCLFCNQLPRCNR